MIRVINGTRYNTATSHKITDTYISQWNVWASVYKTRKGCYFLEWNDLDNLRGFHKLYPITAAQMEIILDYKQIDYESFLLALRAITDLEPWRPEDPEIMDITNKIKQNG